MPSHAPGRFKGPFNECRHGMSGQAVSWDTVRRLRCALPGTEKGPQAAIEQLLFRPQAWTLPVSLRFVPSRASSQQ